MIWFNPFARWTASSWQFERSNLVFSARCNLWAAHAMINCNNLVVNALIFNAVWALDICPYRSCGSDYASFIQARAHISTSNTGGTVEQSSVCTLAAEISLDASTLCTNRLAKPCTAEADWITVGSLVFIFLI
jgi:hypothetical protein